MTYLLKSKNLFGSLRKCRQLHQLNMFNKNTVFVSSCQNIFYNLALEDWIYSNIDFTKRHKIVLLWRNQPCIVVGRHQNVWSECDLKSCEELGVDVARRRSGGGTVYHDLGNLNCTVFSHKKNYNREANLQIVANVLKARGLDVSLNARDDLLLDSKYKISGTGAKLGGKVAYHHFTLLLDVNTKKLTQLLRPSLPGIITKATESVSSTVKNLRDVDPSLTYEQLLGDVCRAFQEHFNCESQLQYLDPTHENKFPGILKCYQDLKSWDWIYGKTPKFSVKQDLNIDNVTSSFATEINKGRLSNIDVSCAERQMETVIHKISQSLAGATFTNAHINQALVPLEVEFTKSNDTLALNLIKCIKKALCL